MQVSENMTKVIAHLIQVGRMTKAQVPSDYKTAVNLYLRKQQKETESDV